MLNLDEVYKPKEPTPPMPVQEWRNPRKFAFWRSILAITCGLVCAVSHAQQSCDRSYAMSVTTAGYTQIVPLPGSQVQSLHICAIQVVVSQGTTPANYQVIACNGPACAVNDPNASTALYTGHANAVDQFSLGSGAATVWSVRKTYGLYLNLSAVPTGAQTLVLYGLY